MGPSKLLQPLVKSTFHQGFSGGCCCCCGCVFWRSFARALSKRRRLLPGEKKRPEGSDWILFPQNSGSENRSERSRTNRVARDRGSKVQFCAPNPLSMAAMSAACAACCGTRLITHGHVFLGRRKPRFKVCISKNIPHPFQNFGWVDLCFSEKHTYLPNRQSMFSGVRV